jgi:hypothetical protein
MALAVGDAAMNIDETLDAFLAEQRQRLAARTYRSYEEIVELFLRCMNDYGHASLTGDDRSRWEERYENDDNAYTAMFGPEMIPVEIGQFLGWYVTRKVMPSQELARACGTVTKKLGSWLESNGLIMRCHGHHLQGHIRLLAVRSQRMPVWSGGVRHVPGTSDVCPEQSVRHHPVRTIIGFRCGPHARSLAFDMRGRSSRHHGFGSWEVGGRPVLSRRLVTVLPSTVG